jgi:superfamily II RNA helicase
LVNKKRKETEREMQFLKDENRTILQDIVTTNDYLQLEIQYDHENIALEFMDTYIQKQTDTICDVLVDEGFIEVKETEPVKKYGFIEMGKIAANIAEVHPLIMGKLMVASNYFQYYSVRQLVGLFSCFTDIKLPSDERASSPQTNDAFLKEQIRELSKEYDRYASLEQDRQLRTGINYYDALVYDLVDIAMQWCNCENEEDCKYFIQTNVFEKGISIGEFNKAMMKITTVAKELMSTCEQIGQIELLHKLTQIEGLVLKYVATAQSLYV